MATIGLIDDNIEARQVVADRLTCEGHEVICFCSALEYMRAGAPYSSDMVLIVDFQMPVMDGIDFANQYRERLGRIIILTNDPSGAAEKARGVGLDPGGLTIVARNSLRELRKLIQKALEKPTLSYIF